MMCLEQTSAFLAIRRRVRYPSRRIYENGEVTSSDRRPLDPHARYVTEPIEEAVLTKTAFRFIASIAALLFLTLTEAQVDESARVTELRWVDGLTETELGILQNGSIVVPAESSGSVFGFAAETTPANVGSVRFLFDGETVWIDDEPPYLVTFRLELDGSIVFDEVIAGRTITEASISAGTDDAEEFQAPSESDPQSFLSGYTYTASSDLELGSDPDHAPQAIGLRFATLDISKGATIAEATLMFTSVDDASGPFLISVHGEASAASSTFSQDPDGAGTRGVTSRLETEASVTWRFTADDDWEEGRVYTSPDLSGIVQEIVDLEAWEEGSPMTFILSSSDGESHRRADSFDSDPAHAVTVRVTYTIRAMQKTFETGQHTLTAIPYTDTDATGEEGAAYTVRLETAGVADGLGEAEPASSELATEPATADESAAARTRSEPDVATARRNRFALMPLGDREIGGSTLVSDYTKGPLVIAVAFARVPDDDVRLELWRGSCSTQDELIARLEPYRADLGYSVTPLQIGFATLRYSGTSVQVIEERSGAVVACSELALTP